MNNTKIENILPGTFFSILKNLTQLDLSYNSLSTIHNDLMKMEKLTVLNLNNNNINYLDFSFLPSNLLMLKMKNNIIANDNLDKSSTHNVKKLLFLDLSNNKITEIPTLKTMKTLKSLYLDHNNITNIKAGAFLERGPQFLILSLNHNSINQIEPEAFLPLRNLFNFTLNLKGNRFSTIPEAVTVFNHSLQLILSQNNIKKGSITSLNFFKSFNDRKKRANSSQLVLNLLDNPIPCCSSFDLQLKDLGIAKAQNPAAKGGVELGYSCLRNATYTKKKNKENFELFNHFFRDLKQYSDTESNCRKDSKLNHEYFIKYWTHEDLCEPFKRARLACHEREPKKTFKYDDDSYICTNLQELCQQNEKMKFNNVNINGDFGICVNITEEELSCNNSTHYYDNGKFKCQRQLKKQNNTRTGVIVGSITASVATVLLGAVVFWYCDRKVQKAKDALGGKTPEQFVFEQFGKKEIKLQSDEEYYKEIIDKNDVREKSGILENSDVGFWNNVTDVRL
eukprot:Pgem_evm1s1114